MKAIAPIRSLFVWFGALLSVLNPSEEGNVFQEGNGVKGSVMPPPFTRVLQVQQPAMTGSDVVLAQLLLTRAVDIGKPLHSGTYDEETAALVEVYRSERAFPKGGGFDSTVAASLLHCCSADGFVYDGFPASSMGYKYLIWVPVHTNRSIETAAVLYDGSGVALYSFTTRTHGHEHTGESQWPQYTHGLGLNEFTTNGNTPTGLMAIDLNSPEGDSEVYGPYNINRVVSGLEGNAKKLVPGIRSGILIHTGMWPGWSEGMPMPNSAGCVHAHPKAIETLSSILMGMGVEVRKNPKGADGPYPHKPQGLLAVQLVDRM